MGKLSGNINGEGNLVLQVYYTRNTYKISNANPEYGSVTNTGTYAYGSSVNITSTATPFPDCKFLGWYVDGECVSSDTSYTFTAEYDVEARFDGKDEMSLFNFTVTQDSCTITGIKDKSVTEIIVPDCVTSIGSYAFYECYSLTSVTIPDSVESIGYAAFEYCESLTSITLPFVGATKDGTSKTHFGYIFGADSYSDNYRYVPHSLKTVVITGGSSIGSFAFYDCDSLTSVTIGDSVTNIGDGAFVCCRSLTSITIPNSVTSIGDNAFEDCTSLTSIVIPDSVESIGVCAFSGCTSLTIYCEAESEPSGWASDSRWNIDNCPVVWGYKGN